MKATVVVTGIQKVVFVVELVFKIRVVSVGLPIIGLDCGKIRAASNIAGPCALRR